MKTANPKDLKVSYCTTCKGRLHHLQGPLKDGVGKERYREGTLYRNLKAEENNPNVEFVLLSYGKDAEMDAWVKENFQNEIDSGRLKYVVYPAGEKFKMAHAKNMAHRMASGDVLVNLDADNLIAKDYSQWLNKVYQKNMHTTVNRFGFSKGNLIEKGLVEPFNRRVLRRQPEPERCEGTYGRIVLSREDYYALNGYDEQFTGWSPDDYNMALRASQANLKVIDNPLHLRGDAFDHDNEERVKNQSSEDRKASEARLQQREKDFKSLEQEFSKRPLHIKVRDKVKFFKEGFKKLREEAPNSNPDGKFGCGEVYVNFSTEPTIIGPVNSKGAEAEQEAMGTTTIIDTSFNLKNNWRYEELLKRRTAPEKGWHPSPE